MLDNQSGREKQKGLPRGLLISSTLAEIYLADLERKIRSLPGVYLVSRYVDDIVVVSSEIGCDLCAEVRAIAKESGLKLNSSKTSKVIVSCECDQKCSHGLFCPCLSRCVCKAESRCIEYLGYSFHFSSRNKSSGDNAVKITLSKQKIKKIKSRIILSSRSYVRTNDFELYLSRLEYIVGNLQIMSKSGNRGLSTGLAYTHSEYSLSPEEDASDGGDFTVLNEFIRRSIRFSLKLRPQPPVKALQAYKFNFLSGYFSRRRVKLSNVDVERITECWRNV